MTTQPLTDLQAFTDAVERHAAVVLFKHSPICPTSTRALAEWERFCRDVPDSTRLFVDVIADRAVARGIAAECGVAHESPQAIVFRDGAAVWSASHFDITAEDLARAWKADAGG